MKTEETANIGRSPLRIFDFTIVNHTIVGYPYIPICKFRLFRESDSGSRLERESEYINPPLYNPMTGPASKGPSQIKQDHKDGQGQVSSSFPLHFGVPANEVGTLGVKPTTYKLDLVELAKNGREKVLGYTRITFNHDVIGKKSKHKVVRSLDGERVQGAGEIISILEVTLKMADQPIGHQTAQKKSNSVISNQIGSERRSGVGDRDGYEGRSTVQIANRKRPGSESSSEDSSDQTESQPSDSSSDAEGGRYQPQITEGSQNDISEDWQLSKIEYYPQKQGSISKGNPAVELAMLKLTNPALRQYEHRVIPEKINIGSEELSKSFKKRKKNYTYVDESQQPHQSIPEVGANMKSLRKSRVSQEGCSESADLSSYNQPSNKASSNQPLTLTSQKQREPNRELGLPSKSRNIAGHQLQRQHPQEAQYRYSDAMVDRQQMADFAVEKKRGLERKKPSSEYQKSRILTEEFAKAFEKQAYIPSPNRGNKASNRYKLPVQLQRSLAEGPGVAPVLESVPRSNSSQMPELYFFHRALENKKKAQNVTKKMRTEHRGSQDRSLEREVELFESIGKRLDRKLIQPKEEIFSSDGGHRHKNIEKLLLSSQDVAIRRDSRKGGNVSDLGRPQILNQEKLARLLLLEQAIDEGGVLSKKKSVKGTSGNATQGNNPKKSGDRFRTVSEQIVDNYLGSSAKLQKQARKKSGMNSISRKRRIFVDMNKTQKMRANRRGQQVSPYEEGTRQPADSKSGLKDSLSGEAIERRFASQECGKKHEISSLNQEFRKYGHSSVGEMIDHISRTSKFRLQINGLQILKKDSPTEQPKAKQPPRPLNDEYRDANGEDFAGGLVTVDYRAEKGDDTNSNSRFSQEKSREPEEVFVKMFVEGRKNSTEFVTPSKHTVTETSSLSLAEQRRLLGKALQSHEPQLGPSKLTYSYESCEWDFLEEGGSNGAVFTQISKHDFLMFEAYSDLSMYDYHEFFGKCIISVNQILECLKLRKELHSNTITGYLIHKGKVKGHITLSLSISEQEKPPKGISKFSKKLIP